VAQGHDRGLTGPDIAGEIDRTARVDRTGACGGGGLNHGLLADARLARQELFGQRSEIVVNRSGRSPRPAVAAKLPAR